MRKIQANVLSFFLLLGLGSTMIFFPSKLKAQNAGSPFSNKPKSDPNDDHKLCGERGPLVSDKFCTYYAGYNNNIDTNKAQAIEYRNRMIDLLKLQIDEYYDAHIHGRVVKTKWFQTVLDVLGIGLAFSGNIVGGLRSKTVLAATSGSFQAGRNSANDRFSLLQNQVLINKMNSNRLNQWAEIVTRKNEGVDANEYSWDRAKGDLQHYLFLGSFTNALDSLIEQTGVQVQMAQTSVQNALKDNSRASLTNKLHNFTAYIVPMNTMAVKLDAAIKASPAEEVELKKKKANLMENYKNIWVAIKATGDFDVIDQKIQAKFGTSPDVTLAEYNKVNTNYLVTPITLTADEYDKALTKINVVVGDDDEMNKRFLAILKLYKL